MERIRFGAWRALFVLAGFLIVIGGMNHPRGTLAEMLAHSDWTWSHTVMLFGFLALLWGLVLFGRSTSPPPRTARWLRWAVIGTGLQVLEMAFHTVSVVDADHAAAGHFGPVLGTHLVLAVVLYPIFAATVVGLIVAGSRDRSLGTPWLAWLGIVGVVAHGIAPPLNVALPFLFDVRIPGAGLLFPMLLLFAAWLVATGLWPLRRSSGVPVAPAAAEA